MSRDLGKRQKVTIFDPEIFGATKKHYGFSGWAALLKPESFAEY